MLNFAEVLHGQNRRCARTIRYSSYFVHRPESDAEHQFYNGIYSLVIGEYLEQQGVQINWKRLLGGAILHDMEEATTGDITTRVKHGSTKIREGLDELSEELVKQMFANLDKDAASKVGEALYLLWRHAKDPATVEGRIVKLADVMCVVAYVAEEVVSGNVYMSRLLRETEKRLEIMREKFGNETLLQPVFEEVLGYTTLLVKKLSDGTLGDYLARTLYASEEDSRARMVRSAGAS